MVFKRAFGQLGYGFKSADLELGHIRGTGQTLPFYQDIELTRHRSTPTSSMRSR